jgi:hypothetical protein
MAKKQAPEGSTNPAPPTEAKKGKDDKGKPQAVAAAAAPDQAPLAEAPKPEAPAAAPAPEEGGKKKG